MLVYIQTESPLTGVVNGDIMPTAFVLIKCEEGEEPRIVRKLAGTDWVREVKPTVGHYDLLTRVASPSVEQLNEVIEKIHGHDKVRSTKVLLKMNEIAEAA
ncbi:MAG: Lrp/AsnC family transcriptional regulator [Thaumarchaeota archaeon]|nr:MAG: Lrp/AsnC family transcriptional regulator [Nitrososphaerota archaeon]